MDWITGLRFAYALITDREREQKVHNVLQEHVEVCPLFPTSQSDARTEGSALVHAAQQQNSLEQKTSISSALGQCAPEEHAIARSDSDPERTLRVQRRKEEKRPVRARRTKQWSPEKRAAWEQQREEERRRKNERRLEGQRQEFERKRNAQRKAEEEAAARTPSLLKETLDEGKPHDQQRKDEALQAHGEQQISERMEDKAGDQKATTGTSAAHLGNNPDTASPTPMNEEFLESHLMSRVCVPRSPWHNETVIINSSVMMGIHWLANLSDVLCATFPIDHIDHIA
jgi:hypothetical protein